MSGVPRPCPWLKATPPSLRLVRGWRTPRYRRTHARSYVLRRDLGGLHSVPAVEPGPQREGGFRIGKVRRRSPAALDWGAPWTRGRRHPCPYRPRVPPKSRWTPPTKWPVLPDEREGGHGPAPSGRPPSGSCGRSRAGPRWPLRSAVATSRGVPAQGPVVVSLQSRRCSCRAGTSRSRPASTSRAAIRNGRFLSVHQWPDLRVHRG